MHLPLLLVLLLFCVLSISAQKTLPYQSITGPTDGSSTFSLPPGVASTGSASSSLIYVCPTPPLSAGTSVSFGYGLGPECVPPSQTGTEGGTVTIQTSPATPTGTSSGAASTSSSASDSGASASSASSSASTSSSTSATAPAPAANAASRTRGAAMRLPGERLGLGMKGTLCLGLGLLVGLVALLDWVLLVL